MFWGLFLVFVVMVWGVLSGVGGGWVALGC